MTDTLDGLSFPLRNRTDEEELPDLSGNLRAEFLERFSEYYDEIKLAIFCCAWARAQQPPRAGEGDAQAQSRWKEAQKVTQSPAAFVARRESDFALVWSFSVGYNLSKMTLEAAIDLVRKFEQVEMESVAMKAATNAGGIAPSKGKRSL